MAEAAAGAGLASKEREALRIHSLGASRNESRPTSQSRKIFPSKPGPIVSFE